MFTKISEKNIHSIALPKESNLVNYSTFNELETDLLFRSFSIKYVVEGCEKYGIEGSVFKVNSGEFLLANNLTGGKVLIESNKPVNGLCIDISPKIMNEAAMIFQYPDFFEEGGGFDESFFCSNLYPENKYRIENNSIGANLKEIATVIASNPNYNFEFTNEFYFELATCLIENQKCFPVQIKRIEANKIRTKKQLFTKLHQGKLFVDNHFLTIKSVNEIAQACQMSEFQFFRLFKLLFEISPFQYLNRKKLTYACSLIKQQNYTLSEIALMAGFSDLPTFSKCFKKNFGVIPYSLKKNGWR